MLLYYLKILADKDAQHLAWILNKDADGNVNYDNFDEAIHFLYDDSSFGDAPEKMIGSVLKNEEEAKAVWKVILALNALFDEAGLSLSDKEYMNHNKWGAVIAAAQAALEVIK